MKTLKFMLAAATAIGLASAYADPDGGASTTFESLANGTPVVTGLNEEGGLTGDSYYYFDSNVAEDNESVIVSGTPDIARPTGATGDRDKVLQVSTGTDPLLRAFRSFTHGSSPAASTFTQPVYVDTLVQFTVTPYTDDVTAGDADKLMVYLKESTNEVNGTLTYSTNLVVKAGYYSDNGQLSTKEYKVSGVNILPNTWHRLTVKAIPDVLLDENDEGVEGSKCIGFVVYLDGSETPCQFDSRTFDLADETSFAFFSPSKYFTELIEQSKLVISLKGMVSGNSTLTAVGFAGEGKVDDLMITTVDPFFTAVDFTFAAVSGVTKTQTPGSNTYTFEAPEGTVLSSFLVNGETPVDFTVGATSYEWTATDGDAGALVVVAAGKALTAPAHAWYENPGAIALVESLPLEGAGRPSAFHGQGQDEYLGLTYGTNPMQFDLYTVDGTSVPTSVYEIPAANVTTPGFRGVAISKPLGIAMTLAYAKTTTMYAYPLSGGEPIAVTKSADHAFDAGAFSPDGAYFFSNNIEGESSKNYYVKWSVAMTTNSLTLTKVGSIAASGRGRNMAYGRISGRDLVFAMADTGKIDVIDMTGDTPANWTSANLVSELPSLSYGTLCVSGLNVSGVNPTLTVATSFNDGALNDVLNVYTLTVPASGAVTASLTKSFNQTALTAAGFGEPVGYGNTVYVTDDNKTIYFARADQKLYVGQWAVARTSTGLYESFKDAVENATAGDTVTVLQNCTESGMVTISNAITIVNNYTVSLTGMYALRFANGSTPVTISGTGTLAGSGEGSPLLIGSNETTKNAKYEITTTYEGSVILDGNTITYSGSGNVIKVENGAFTMNSGTVTAGGNRGVKADADVGNFTSTVTINGGTITSTKAAVAVSADTGTASATITGGSLTGPITCGQKTGTATLTIPGTSSAQFDRDQSSFCAAGYETTDGDSDGWFTVTAIPSYTITFISGEGSTTNESTVLRGAEVVVPKAAEVEGKEFDHWDPAVVTPAAGNATYTAVYVAATPSGLEPGADVTNVVVTAESVEAAIAAVTVTAPAGSNADPAAYKALFNITATAGEGGTFNVAITGIKDEVVEDVNEDALNVFSGDTSVTVPAGLYYKITPSTALPISGTPQSGLSTGAALTVAKPGTTTGFLKVELSTKAFE